MKCPKCGHPKCGVIESRKHPTWVRRRRQCPKCRWYWYTRERPEEPEQYSRGEHDAISRA
jgi:transcriptional regulator NrdR family protein